MKVLLYAVFKERGVDSPSAGDRITKDERNRKRFEVRTLKAKQCSPEKYRAFSGLDFVAQSLVVVRPLRFFAPREAQKFAVFPLGDSLLREPRNRC